MNCPSHVFHRACTVIHILSQCVQRFDVNDGSQGNIIQREGSDSLKTALETRGKTAWLCATISFHYC